MGRVSVGSTLGTNIEGIGRNRVRVLCTQKSHSAGRVQSK